MNVRTLKLGSILGTGLTSLLLGSALVLAGALLVGLTPGVSYAQGTTSLVTVWEVEESLVLKPAEDTTTFVRRLADAALVGEAAGPLCTLAGTSTPCKVSLVARSRVDFGTLTGPITGTFHVLVQNPTNPLTDVVLVAATGELRGTLDFCPVVHPITGQCVPVPFGTVNGTWKLKDLHARGTLTGLFQMPVPASALGYGSMCDVTVDDFETGIKTLPGYAYVGPAGAQCLRIEDYSLGKPLVKFTATLVKD